jgi:predicted deacylase
LERLDDICAIELPTGDTVGVRRRRFSAGTGPHVAIVAGLRGDTPEGVRVAARVCRHLAGLHERLTGTVDVYGCVNPLAAQRSARAWPGFDLDLNRRFPGRASGHAPDRVAEALLRELRPADQVIELRGAHPAFREVAQAQVRVDQPEALERALGANVQVVWQRGVDLVGSGTLAEFRPDLVCLEGGCGNRLTEGVGDELRDGVLNVLARMAVVPEDGLPFHWAAIQRPEVVGDDDVLRVRTERAGMFVPDTTVGAELEAGACIGEVVDPAGGEPLASVHAPVACRILALREQPVVQPGSLAARCTRRPA